MVAHVEVGQGIGVVGVCAEHTDGDVRRKGLQKGRDYLREGEKIGCIVRSLGEGDVNRISLTCPFTDLGFIA